MIMNKKERLKYKISNIVDETILEYFSDWRRQKDDGSYEDFFTNAPEHWTDLEKTLCDCIGLTSSRICTAIDEELRVKKR
ncbi:hypothetical protein FACS1894178_6760 [Bacteroidia bacterium]|nr:hypothetical protein FACS1894178_6760 [Bacteroidia bacterium]